MSTDEEREFENSEPCWKCGGGGEYPVQDDQDSFCLVTCDACTAPRTPYHALPAVAREAIYAGAEPSRFLKMLTGESNG